jgi:hypothetical protein
MKLSKPYLIENLLIKKGSNIKLEEALDLDYIKQVEDDIRTFLKNVNRLKNYEDFWELWDYWNYWKQEIYEIFEKRYAGKGLGSHDAIIKDTISGKLITRLSKAINGLFYVDDTDLNKYTRKNGNSIVATDEQTGRNYFIDTLVIGINTAYKAHYEQLAGPGTASLENLLFSYVDDFLQEAKETYFMVWEMNANSRYISTKKIVDKVFEEIYSYDLPFDKYIEENLEYLGVEVSLYYEEGDEDNIYKAYKYVESALDQLSRKGVLNYFKDVEIAIDFIEANKNTEFSTSYSKVKQKAGGLYKGIDNLIILYKNTSSDAIIVILHELGHSYYSKQMSPSQRIEFEEFFKELVEGEATDISGYKKEITNFVDLMRDKALNYYDEVVRVLENDYLDVTKEVPKNEITHYFFNRKQFTLDMFYDFLKEFVKNVFPELSEFIFGNISNSTFSSYFKKEYTDEKKSNGVKEEYIYSSNNVTIKALSGLALASVINAFTSALSLSLQNIKNNKKDRSKIPSKYAGENPGELFAELFAYYFGFNLGLGFSWGMRYKDVDREVIDVFKGIAGLRERVIRKKHNYLR